MQALYRDANQKLQQGYYDAAIKEARDGYRRSQSDISWNWRFRILEAEVLLRNRQSKDSVALLTEDTPASLPVEIAVRKKLVQAQALCWSKRQPDGQRVIHEAENIPAIGNSSLQGELNFAQGICAFGEPEIARKHFEEAADLLRESNPFLTASALGNVGYLYAHEGHYDEAIDWYQKVLPLAKSTNSLLLLERILGNLGDCYSNLGDFKRSIEESEQAQRIAEQIGNLDDEESWLVTLGRNYDSLYGEYPDKAEPEYRHALSIATKLKDKDTLAVCLHNLAQLAIHDQDIKKAEDYWKKEIASLAPGDSVSVDMMLDEAEISAAKRDRSRAKEIFSAILHNPKTIPLRSGVAHDQLAQIYWSEGASRNAGDTLREGMQGIEAELANIKFAYRVSYMDQASSLFDTYIRFLVAEHEPITALQIAEHQHTLVQDEHPLKADALNVRLIQQQLKLNEVVLDYAVTDEESYLWTITKKQFQVFQLPSHRELSNLIDAYNTSIQEQRTIEESFGGQELYKALIQPAEHLIPKGATVVIVPSKVLCLLNFETVIVPGRKPHYWMEDVAIENSDSLLQLRKKGPGRFSKNMLLIGAPKEVNSSFPTLKYASDEIVQVKDEFPSADAHVLTGANATPQAYEESAPQKYRFIHFVTHGIASEKVPMESAIILSGTPDSYKLYARDIIDVPLNADLVTISACYGAGKRWYTSEGMVGLGWAFMHAGARQVVAALWEVDDASTPRLMNRFYSELNRGKTAADALRIAKLELLRQGGVYDRPYYWASLQLYTRLPN